MNIFIRDLSIPNASKSTDKMITNEPKRAIRSVSWAYDSSTIFYMNDNDGDENFHLFAVDALSAFDTDEEGFIPPVKDLTPGDDVKAQKRIPS